MENVNNWTRLIKNIKKFKQKFASLKKKLFLSGTNKLTLYVNKSLDRKARALKKIIFIR